jgi:hypothetical protein
MIFVATDPRGYEVQLTDECWYNHIVVEHPEMIGRMDDVRRAIEMPDYIYESKHKPSSHLYFLEVGRSSFGTEYVLGVAAIRQRTSKGYVQTAFLVDGLSKGGKLLWKKP